MGGSNAPGQPGGVVIALCAGHRCAALTRTRRDGGLAAAVARSSGGMLISAPCLQRCAEGAVGAVALSAGTADSTGPSVWLGGLESAGRLEALRRWVEHWHPGAERAHELPDDLRDAVLGIGPPIRLTPAMR
ncbi:hypothetical protein [Arthrobacter sp. NPDC092385]|uniref:hypothetical protein n=1 Tax=Arthrobacter sp. NPDC092385 TaxID=3363943 RepID=UPI0037FDEA9A